MNQANTNLFEKALSMNELKEMFFSIKVNKSTGYDEISFNITKNCFGELHKPIMYLFDLTPQTRVFLCSLKVAKLTPLLLSKTCDPEYIGY